LAPPRRGRRDVGLAVKRAFGTPIVEYVPALVMVAVTIAYLATAYTYSVQARLFPVPVGWLMLLLLALDLVSRTKTPTGEALTRLLNPAAEAEGVEQRFPLLRQLSAILWVAFFTVALVLIGIMYAVPLYVFGSMRFHGKKSYLTSLITAVCVTVFTWLLFGFALQVELYPGMLFSEF
jgi:Tripartite tricarboxylate transporter TctB family